jgi:ketosteroid isomerase-like protein
MSYRNAIVLVFGGLLLLLVPAHANQADKAKQPPKEDPAHEELRALKRELEDASNKGDIDGVLARLDKDVVVTWLNGEVSLKPEGVRAYLERMTKGPNRAVNSFKTFPTVDDLTHLYGDTGVAYGSSKDRFELTDGRVFEVPTRWSATLVKKNGKWLVANFHASTNMFDNPVLDIAIRKTATWAGGIGAGAGLLLGFLAGWFLRKRRTAGAG